MVLSRVEVVVRGNQRDMGPGSIETNPVEYYPSWSLIPKLTSRHVGRMDNKGGGGQENIDNDRNNDGNHGGTNVGDNDRINTLLGGNNDWRDGPRGWLEKNEEE